MVYYHFEIDPHDPTKSKGHDVSGSVKSEPGKTQADVLTCTAEGCDEPRADQDPDATNRHCRKHRNEATKKYLMSKAEQEEAKAFQKGVEAMREHIAKNFEVYGPGQKWTGPQFANIVRGVEAPKFRAATS